MISIISDNQHEYTDFIAESLINMENFNIDGIAFVALTKDGQALTGYWNMNVRGKSEAKNNIEYDIIDEIIMVNRERYFTGDEEEDV